MSVINKKPYIQSVVESLTDEQLNMAYESYLKARIKEE